MRLVESDGILAALGKADLVLLCGRENSGKTSTLFDLTLLRKDLQALDNGRIDAADIREPSDVVAIRELLSKGPVIAEMHVGELQDVITRLSGLAGDTSIFNDISTLAIIQVFVPLVVYRAGRRWLVLQDYGKINWADGTIERLGRSLIEQARNAIASGRISFAAAMQHVPGFARENGIQAPPPLQSKLTTKAQTVIPDRVRQHLGVSAGDSVTYDLVPGGAVIRPAVKSDENGE